MPVVLAALLVGSGCERKQEGGASKADLSKAPTEASPADREPASREYPPDPIQTGSAELAKRLPPAVSDLGSDVPRTYPDGAWSVLGLRQDIRTHEDDGAAGQKLVLRAYVNEIYVPECPSGEVCATEPAHVWVSDRPKEKNPHRRMLVVGYDDHNPPISFQLGKQVSMRGSLSRVSEDGEFVDLLGLLELDSLE